MKTKVAGVLRTENSVERPLRAECSDEERLELTVKDHWYVAQTLHHREKLAELHLNAQGFRTFFPRFRKTVRHARQLRNVIAPVFPGYIFVSFNRERDRWRSINGTLGVARLITAQQQPVRVPPGIVEALIAGLDGSDLVTFNGGLMLGQTVRIIAGPLAGGLGVLQRLDARGRVRLLLEIMGGQAPVVIDRSHIAAG
jgi:transcription elongation factor/antiterminator RfaH